MFYYKKNNQIYSFAGASLSPSEYQDFMSGVLEGTLVGDYFTAPYQYCRRSDNTIWGLAIELSDSELALFHTGTLSFSREEIIEDTPSTVEYNAVFLSYPITHPSIEDVPDWSKLRQLLYRTMAFIKAVSSQSNKFSFVSDCIIAGELRADSVFQTTLRDAILSLKGDLHGTEYAFDSVDITAINTALAACGFTVEIT